MEVIGHQNQIRFLKRMIQENKIPHALLFSGQEKLGKKKIALDFISALLAGNLRSHPDFILLEKREGEQIQIDQIREISWKLSLKPMKAKFLAGIIDNAHLMTKEAQNCFLKTLEEPKTNSLIILITAYPNFLLPTIISRCQEIKFYPVKTKEIRIFLEKEKIPKREIEKLEEISLGRPGLVIDLLKNPEKWQEREKWLKKLISLPKISLFEKFQFAKELAESEDSKEILENYLEYFRQLFLKKNLGKEIENFNYPILKLKKIIEKIQEIISPISPANLNLKLAIENLMLEF